MHRVTVTMVLVGVLGAFVLGVGNVGSASVLATKKPCELLKVAQITKIIGQPVGAAKEGQPNPVLTQCYWNVQQAGTLPPGTVGTVVQTSLAKETYASNRTVPTAKRVRGIKKAFYVSNIETLSVLRGDVLLSVQVLSYGTENGLQDPPHYKQIVKLTKIALKRLG